MMNDLKIKALYQLQEEWWSAGCYWCRSCWWWNSTHRVGTSANVIRKIADESKQIQAGVRCGL